MNARTGVSLAAAGCAVIVSLQAAAASAQPLGTFRWQLQPFCNVVTLAVTQNGGVYRLEGTDDQCGSGADQASAIGTAFQNPDGSIGFGLTIVVSPGGAPVHVDAEIALATLGGTWRDSTGNSGAFTLTPGAGTGGTARPLPVPIVPVAIQLRPDGGLVAAGALGPAPIPISGGGVRMMWHPARSAFRVGQVSSDQWDEANVGPNSMAFGVSTVASEVNSTALGAFTRASGIGSTAMGNLTTASGFNSTSMGNGTTASGADSTALGRRTTASGNAGTAMGSDTTASGASSLAAGSFLSAGGTSSIALGSHVAASTQGTFMFGDMSTNTSMITVDPNQFLVRAAGGVGFYTNATLTSGVTLAPGGGAWASVSDVNRKQHFRDLDGDDVLAKLARLSIQEWSYKAQDASIRHVGPTAQAFHAAFGLGEDPLRISTIDADGVALRAIQALEARDRGTAAGQVVELERLRARVDDLARQLAEALARVRALEAR